MKIRSIFSVTFLTGLVVSATLGDVLAQNTQIIVTGIRSPKGQVIVSIFKDEKGYEEEKPFKSIPFDKKALNSGKLVLECSLEPGTYGITLLDDENKNGKMEKTFIGVPKEGFGFSNFFMEKLKKPSFSDFKTNIKSKGNRLEIKVKYM